MSNRNPNYITRFHSGKEAERLGRKGGISSGQSRREYASFKTAFQEMLTDEDKLQMIRKLIDLAKTGDIRAYETLVDTMGEKSHTMKNKLNQKGYTLREWENFFADFGD